MSEIDAKSLTSEERAIVDRRAWEMGHSTWSPDECYRQALFYSEPFIRARRALFGSPASEPAKVECEEEEGKWTGNVKCPDCGRLVNEAHCGGPNHVYQRVKPAQPESVAKQDFGSLLEAQQRYVAEHGAQSESVAQCRALSIGGCDYNLAGQCIYCREFKPEPVAAEMPEAVRWAIETLLNCAVNAPHWDAHTFRCRAADLESFWRTHAAQPAKADLYGYIKRELDDLLGLCGAIIALEGVPLNWKFAAEIRDKAKTLAAKVEIADVSHRTGFSPPAAQSAKVRMTEELETILRFAYECADEYGQIRTKIAAVRTQAAEAGVKLPKVRAGLEELMKASRNSHWLDLCKSLLAELDAAEGRK